MKIVSFIVSIFLAFQLSAQGIQFFEGSWKDAMAKAKAEDKLLFVDAYAKWCGPCKAMAKNVFTQAHVGDYFNANFINLKLDMEETDGVTFGHKYPVQAYPTLFFIDGDGKVVKTIRGGQQPDGLISLGKDAITKIDKSGKYEAKYLAGDRSYDLVYNYISALNAARKPSLKIANDFLASNPTMTETQKLSFYLEAASEADSKLFNTVEQNRSEIIKLVGVDEFDKKVTMACRATVDKAIEFEMISLLEEAKTKAKKNLTEAGDEFGWRADMTYYTAFKNPELYKEASDKLAKKYWDEPKELEALLKDINNNFRDNDLVLSAGCKYAQQIYAIKKDVSSLGNYCSMLVASKEVEKAIKEVEKAIKRAEKDNSDITQLESMLTYLQSKRA